MTSILIALLVLLVAALCVWLLKNGMHNGRIIAANVGEGISPTGMLPGLRADAAHSKRYLLVKHGTDENHLAVCGASDWPLGVCPDQPAAAEDPAACAALGATLGTMLMQASEALAITDEVYTAANGEVQNLPAGAGTYYKVGRPYKAVGAAGPVQVIPCYPVKVVVT